MVFGLFVFQWAFLPSFVFAEETKKNGLYFSIVPKKNVDQQIKELLPLLQLLEEKLKRSVSIIRPLSYHSVIEGILSETIDFAILGPASYAKTKARDSRVKAFASFAKKKGFMTPQGSYYYSVLFTLKSSGFGSIEELKGKRIAFTDPESTSGSVIPNISFSKRIQPSLKEFFGTHIYTGSHDRSIESVITKDVDAAFVSSARIDEAVQKGQIKPELIQILWRSDPIHRDPFVFSGKVSDVLQNKIQDILLTSQVRLKPMLENMQMVGIVAVTDKDYQPIHDIIAMQARQVK
ncbi:MAG: phosphate/phosphite/phosphonate ABC transporter substrate-binding protein [Desulfobacteraceae bacterium]